MSEKSGSAYRLCSQLLREIEDLPSPAGNDRLSEDYELALSVIKRLLAKLDETTPDEPWQDVDGNQVPAVRDWMMLVCFSGDHQLYDDWQSLSSRKPASRHTETRR